MFLRPRSIGCTVLTTPQRLGRWFPRQSLRLRLAHTGTKTTLTMERSEPNNGTKKATTKRKQSQFKRKKKFHKGNRNDDTTQSLKKTKNFRAKRANHDFTQEEVHLGSFAHPEMQALFGVNPFVGLTTHDEDTNGNTTTTNDKDSKDETTNDTSTSTSKRKVALLIGFLGSRYGGMQINKRERSLQAVLELALFRAGMVSRANFGFPHKYSWSNAARTDKGVHACAQVCSTKVAMDEWHDTEDAADTTADPTDPTDSVDDEYTHYNTMDCDRVRDRLNHYLPDDVRILDVVKTTKKFCAYTQRDQVRYRYVFPTFLLQPPAELRQMFETRGYTAPPPPTTATTETEIETETTSETEADTTTEAETTSEAETETTTETEPSNRKRRPLALFDHTKNNHPDDHDKFQKLKEATRQFRVSSDQLQALESTLRVYEGTKSYHNYTVGKKANDTSSSRYILKFGLDGSIHNVLNTTDNNNNNNNNIHKSCLLIADDGTEWVSTVVTGQSFLLHQIRKMMGMAIEVTRGVVGGEQFRQSFDRRTHMVLGVAPAQGLFLDMSFFPSYNRRMKEEKVTGNGVYREPLDWDWPVDTDTDTTNDSNDSNNNNNNNNNNDSNDDNSSLTTRTPTAKQKEAVKRWNEFKEHTVMKHIMKEEETEHNFLRFIYIHEYIFDKDRYLVKDDNKSILQTDKETKNTDPSPNLEQ